MSERIEVAVTSSPSRIRHEGSDADIAAIRDLISWRMDDADNRAYAISCTPKGCSVTIGNRVTSAEIEHTPTLVQAIVAGLAAMDIVIGGSSNMPEESNDDVE